MDTSKKLLIACGALLGVALLGVVLMLLTWAASAKSRIERAVSQATGMEVSIEGRVQLRLWPAAGVSLEGLRIHNNGAELVAAQQAAVEIQLLPLLRHIIAISALSLNHATITLVKDKSGHFNFEPASRDQSAAFTLGSLSLSDTTVLFSDERTGTDIRALTCRSSASLRRPLNVTGAAPMKEFFGTAQVYCSRVQFDDWLASDLNFALTAQQGIVETSSITMHAYGGDGSARIHSDFSGAVPLHQLHYQLTKFDIGEFSKTLTSAKVGEGAMDLAADLRLQGDTVAELVQSSKGEASLRGENLTLNIGDLDNELSRYESSQHFDLVDVGAFFFAGPIGLAVTKGYDFARVLKSASGSSKITTLLSRWRVEHGVAEAQDVAMTTKTNRIAMTGSLDFVARDYKNVDIALVNSEGCVRVQQTVRGSFDNPQIDRPSVVRSLVGPAQHLLGKAKRLLGGHCQIFYAGALPAPVNSPTLAF